MHALHLGKLEARIRAPVTRVSTAVARVRASAARVCACVARVRGA